MIKVAKKLAMALILAASASPTLAASPNWLTTWGASPQAPGSIFAATPGPFNGQTIRQVVRISVGGRQLRVRLTNEYGSEPLQIGAAHIALSGENGAIKPGTDRALTFGGMPTVTIAPGAPMLSDPIDLPTSDLASVSISLYFPTDTGGCTCHTRAFATGYLSGKGDFTGSETFPTASTISSWAFLSDIEVNADKRGKAIVVLGDSISDGTGSTPDTNNRWPDVLATRLAGAARVLGPRAVVNEGIGGNRLLHAGIGDSALARFDRDVLAKPGVAYVVVFEGINDIGFSNISPVESPLATAMRKIAGAPVSAESIIGAYKQIIVRAHAHGLKIYGATLTPYEGTPYISLKGDVDRQAVNTWIRTAGAFDGVIDFDAVWRDPDHPSQIKASYQAGDHIHGSDAGYNAAADAIDLSLFK